MRKTVFALLNYIGCIGMALFVTFVIDGTIGMILTYALAIALAASLIMTLAVFRRIGVSTVLSKSAASKGDRLLCEIKLTNAALLPTPLITVELESSAHFVCPDSGVLQGAVTGKGINSLGFELTAVHSGKAHIRIKSVKLSDYLGIFSFRLKLSNELSELTVSVYPDIPEVAVQTSLMKTTTQFVSNDDDEEESEESSAVPTGIAGYDHREYVPGDPIKRINWKMSSKRDILMVRLDERIKGSGRVFVLDCPVAEENDAVLTVRDNVIEGALAMLNSLLADGREAAFFYCKQGLWMSADIHIPADVYALQEELSDFEPCETSELLPPALVDLSKTPIVFTAATGNNAASAGYIVSQRPDAMIIASYAASLPLITSNQWVLSDGFELGKA